MVPFVMIPSQMRIPDIPLVLPTFLSPVIDSSALESSMPPCKSVITLLDTWYRLLLPVQRYPI